HHSGRCSRKYAGKPALVDPEPGRHQARLPDAGHEVKRRRFGRSHALHGDTSVVEGFGGRSMSSDAMAFPSPEAARRPWVQTLHEWANTVDHKRLGILYILYALVFLVIAGLEATIIRIQLMRPHNDFVSPQVFNRMFTMHGTTMIFFVAIPVLFGFANYL